MYNDKKRKEKVCIWIRNKKKYRKRKIYIENILREKDVISFQTKKKRKKKSNRPQFDDN